jgi:hypothetical protein
MTFLWIFIKGPSAYVKYHSIYELDYSIRSVRKYYKGARCVVLGDDPGLDVEFIPLAKTETVRSEMDLQHIDVIKKLSHACNFFDEFVLMYDDIFFLQKITKKDLKRHYAVCEIPDLDKFVRPGGLIYTRIWRNTYKVISGFKSKLYDFETHMPRFLEAEKVKYLIEKYDLWNKNIMLTSLYTAIYGKNYVDLSKNDHIRSHVVQMGPNVDLDKVFSRKFLVIDDPALTPSMMERIKLNCVENNQ